MIYVTIVKHLDCLSILEEGLREYVHLHLFLMFIRGPCWSLSEVNFTARNTEGLERFVKSFSATPTVSRSLFPPNYSDGKVLWDPIEFPLSPALPYKEDSTSQLLPRKCLHGAGTAFSSTDTHETMTSSSVEISQGASKTSF